MKITKLSSQKKDPSRVNMHIDGKFFCGVSLDTVAKFNMYVGKSIKAKELDSILITELTNRFMARAMSYISKSVKTEFQLRRYLKDLSFKKKGDWYSDISKEDLEKMFNEIIDRLKEYKYLDDERFAEEFVLSRVKNKPRGKMILVAELMSKGMNRDLAQQKVDELVEDEYDVLKRIYEKKFKKQKITYDDRKKIDYLMRKGFSWDLIEQFINDESSK
jgi:regulatory protein